MRVFRVKFRLNGKTRKETLTGRDMIRLAAALNRRGEKIEVLTCLGRI